MNTQFSQIIEAATSTLRRAGRHPATIIFRLEGLAPLNRLVLPRLPLDGVQREQRLYALGKQAGTRNAQWPIQQLYFIGEAWLSEARAGVPPHLVPSHDPKRREVLSICELDATDASLPQTVAFCEVIRSRSGKLKEVRPLGPYTSPTEDPIEVVSVLLLSFLAGFVEGTGQDYRRRYPELYRTLFQHRFRLDDPFNAAP